MDNKKKITTIKKPSAAPIAMPKAPAPVKAGEPMVNMKIKRLIESGFVEIGTKLVYESAALSFNRKYIEEMDDAAFVKLWQTVNQFKAKSNHISGKGGLNELKASVEKRLTAAAEDVSKLRDEIAKFQKVQK